MMKRILLSSFVYLSLLVTGCSKLEIAYDFAPGIIAGRMDDYFDLDSKQKAKLKSVIKSELERIVIDHVPRYLELEKEWIVLLQKSDLKKPELRAHNETTRKWLFSVFASMEPALLPLALELSPTQVEYFHKKVLKELEEHDEKIATPKGQKKELKRRFEFGLSWNFGDLNSQEEHEFDEWLSSAQYPFKEESLSRKNSAYLFHEASKSPVAFKKHLEQIFRAPLSFRRQEYADQLEKVLASYQELQWKLLVQSDEKSRKSRVEHTQDHIDQLTKLRDKVVKSKSKP